MSNIITFSFHDITTFKLSYCIIIIITFSFHDITTFKLSYCIFRYVSGSKCENDYMIKCLSVYH